MNRLVHRNFYLTTIVAKIYLSVDIVQKVKYNKVKRMIKKRDLLCDF